ncbi:hypothetical protein SRB17_86780 [Streptomyces sp. RB17]|nr:hypothetical protein [Streptomyces sp. RB17]
MHRTTLLVPYADPAHASTRAAGLSTVEGPGSPATQEGARPPGRTAPAARPRPCPRRSTATAAHRMPEHAGLWNPPTAKQILGTTRRKQRVLPRRDSVHAKEAAPYGPSRTSTPATSAPASSSSAPTRARPCGKPSPTRPATTRMTSSPAQTSTSPTTAPTSPCASATSSTSASASSSGKCRSARSAPRSRCSRPAAIPTTPERRGPHHLGPVEPDVTAASCDGPTSAPARRTRANHRITPHDQAAEESRTMQASGGPGPSLTSPKICIGV